MHGFGGAGVPRGDASRVSSARALSSGRHPAPEAHDTELTQALAAFSKHYEAAHPGRWTARRRIRAAPRRSSMPLRPMASHRFDEYDLIDLLCQPESVDRTKQRIARSEMLVMICKPAISARTDSTHLRGSEHSAKLIAAGSSRMGM